jgi:nicotinamide/nicotinate riboside kinase
MLIGIGGLSRSGKSTLANLLLVYYRKIGKKAIVFHQDDFVFPETKIPKINDKTDWESPQSIDHELLYEVVADFKHRFDVVIVDGFYAFIDPKLNALFDKRIYLKIKRTEFLVRKSKDTRWGYIPGWYFDHIWQAFQKFGIPDFKALLYIQISGQKPFELNSIVKKLEK